MATRVALVTLGCARNDVDSEELAARFQSAGIELTEEPSDADAVVVNTCGFIESAKKDSIDTLLAAADLKQDHQPQAVIAVGCLAERYGDQLAESLPEADAIVGFDSYPDIAATVRSVLAGDRPNPPTPQDRRLLLPLAPVDRGALPAGVAPATGPHPVRRRLDGGPMAPLKIASGCDRRCSFCAIPRFRGAFVSRPPEDVVTEAKWLSDQGVSELFLVSENTTSYGKDLGDLRLLERLLPQLAGLDGIERVRVSYLQPAEMRPGLVEVMASTPSVASYFDLSFQHASGPVLRRMRRFGDTDRFLDLVGSIRQRDPRAGIRSNFIVGFPGETEQDCAELERFLTAARLDVAGVFGYSDEDGTEATRLPEQHSPQTVAERLEYFSRLAEELTSQRAEERIGEAVRLVVEEVADAAVIGRGAHQGPEVDGSVRVRTLSSKRGSAVPAVGSWLDAQVVDAEGVDLVAVLSD